MVRLADLLGADDPEDIAQEAFARLIRKHGSLRSSEAALAYVRASVCNLTRNRHRHLRVVRLRTPAAHHEDSSEQVVMVREDHREVLAALAGLPPRRREAIVLRYWLDLSEREIAAAMGVSRTPPLTPPPGSRPSPGYSSRSRPSTRPGYGGRPGLVAGPGSPSRPRQPRPWSRSSPGPPC